MHRDRGGKLSSVVDWKDRTTCVLFGDAAGAVVLGPSRSDGARIIGTKLYSEGGMSDSSASRLRQRPSDHAATIEAGQHFIKMKGREIFKVAVRECRTPLRKFWNNTPSEPIRLPA